MTGAALVALGAEESRAMDAFYARLRSRAGKTLASLAHVTLNRAHTNYCQMLCELGEEQDIDVAFHALTELTQAGRGLSRDGSLMRRWIGTSLCDPSVIRVMELVLVCHDG